MRALIFVVLTVMAAGCSRTLDVVLPTDRALELEIYSNGSRIGKCQIAPGSSQFKQLQDFMATNSDGWSPTPATYVPSVLVRGTGLSINFLQDFAIVNYQQGQFQRPVPKSGYAFLKCPRGT